VRRARFRSGPRQHLQNQKSDRRASSRLSDYLYNGSLDSLRWFGPPLSGSLPHRMVRSRKVPLQAIENTDVY
jgi:hypothetical protein